MSTPQKKHLRCTIPLENQFVKREEKGINICFTGPRPNQLHGYKEPARPLYSQIADFASKVILQCVERNPGSIFISGGAQGFDQLAFWAVEKAKKARPDLGIANILYIPFESQPSFWSPTGMFGQSEYRRMKRFADTVRFISPNPHPDDRRAVARALFERNHAMVKDSNLVIALLAGIGKIPVAALPSASAMPGPRAARCWPLNTAQMRMRANSKQRYCPSHRQTSTNSKFHKEDYNMAIIQRGSKVRLSGDSADLWIADYNVRVDSLATVEEDPQKYAKKLMVTIDSIDGDHNVLAYVRRSRAIPAEED